MGENVLTVNDRIPHLAETAWIAPTATVVGDVTVGAGTGVFYGAVVRADMEAVTIGENSNVQDTAVLRADPNCPARIGDHVSIGSLVAANALVPEGTVVPPRSLVAGVPAKVRRELTDAEVEQCRANAATYEAITTQHTDATPATIGQPA